jgi:hypothetical protein
MVFRTCSTVSDAIGTIFSLHIVVTSFEKFGTHEATLPHSHRSNLSAILPQIGRIGIEFLAYRNRSRQLHTQRQPLPLGNFILRLTSHTAVIPSKARNLSSATGTPPYGCTVEVVLRHRVDFPAAARRQKLQPDGSLPSNFSNSAGAACKNPTATARRSKVTAAEILSSSSFHAVPIDSSPVLCFETPRPALNHLKLRRISRCSIGTAGIQKTAKIATISTCTDKKLHFSRIFRPITLAFSCRVRYSPLGSNFFAQYSRVDRKNFAARPGFPGRKEIYRRIGRIDGS